MLFAYICLKYHKIYILYATVFTASFFSYNSFITNQGEYLMLKKFKPLLSHILLTACAFSVICRASICLTIFHDNVPPNDLEQWISNKRKRHD